ncbi:MAG TPA: SGNH/GDSL hydrolase family protein [Phycisphaerae bacterium]|nr:SGNH/GDSL hydrolase family protein [Phycisphaerae bacterium]
MLLTETKSGNVPFGRRENLRKTPWGSSVSYREPLLFLRDSLEPPVATLLFEPVEILAAHSSCGLFPYEPGRDFVVETRSRRVFLPEGSRIPHLLRRQLYRRPGERDSISHKAGDENTYLFCAPRAYSRLQMEITYTHRERWTGPAPTLATEQLPKTLARLIAARPLVLGITGDSVSTGCEASRECPPYLPGYADLVAGELHRAHGSRIRVTNLAVGGTTSADGVSVASELAKERPDLTLIAFGLNEMSRRDPCGYQANVRTIMETIRQDNPQAEFILVSPLPGNREWHFTPPEMASAYRDALAALCGPGVAMADVTGIAGEILRRKSYYDLTANGVNHPNDYGHRLYAQVVLGLLTNPRKPRRRVKRNRNNPAGAND